MDIFLYKYLLVFAVIFFFFIALNTHPYTNTLTQEAILKLFNYMDYDNSGFLEKNQMKLLLSCGNKTSLVMHFGMTPGSGNNNQISNTKNNNTNDISEPSSSAKKKKQINIRKQSSKIKKISLGQFKLGIRDYLIHSKIQGQQGWCKKGLNEIIDPLLLKQMSNKKKKKIMRKIYDLNGNGNVQRGEYMIVNQIFSVDYAESIMIFEKFDLDNNGVLEKKKKQF